MKLLFLTFALLISSAVSAKVKVTDLKFSKENGIGTLEIMLSESYGERPELSLRDSFVQIALPNTVVWPKIEKQVTVGARSFDSTLMAYQYNRELARVRAILPFRTEDVRDEVSFVNLGNKIRVTFPLSGQKKVTAATAKKNEKKPTAGKFDETYLDKLLADVKKQPETVSDNVGMALSGQKKNKSALEEFNFGQYIAKFGGFLALILAFFYGVVRFFKKGVLSKSKINFLSNIDTVKVINTTYIGPKRSLLLVKVHNQVLLLSSSEKGVEFLTEVKDTTGVVKDTEKEVLGTNFDTNLEKAEEKPKTFNLKDEMKTYQKMNERPSESTSAKMDSFLKAAEREEEKVSLSDQIKSKVKNLKSLQ